ncbi:dTDP-4-amino-4,6-dideoxygalactose transaminase [Microvirga aerophila]|uniref:dTDP-4-amino-4,6-dideoxy-D-glucose transaminase n=1 Tax=Microvirga aerophila TaxID=670291 RepID=A0A512C3F1_9HYPH|nr:dTDP-4-amino-4,6-dideoxygalactose transaminase [Microvirga aerophila]GEO18745.1 dTDP-4-amino-4,6-dideoxy-D-glucose transaminase [Microvirga aerophila]
MMSKIPYNRPVLAGRELAYISQAIENGQLAGDGPFTSRCQELLRKRLNAEAVLLTHSCTAALEMAAILIGIQPGDEVIMPSFTFVSTANAVVLRGGTPVFVDIRPDTLNIDEKLIEAAINSKTRSIWPVHYAGVSADMQEICAIADRHGLTVVEDAAQALGSTYRNRPAGSFGDLAALSFHETKNIISGEGGALAINNSALMERAEIIREKGTNRKRFFRGQVDKYTWVDIGSSFLPGELIAAFLLGQLEKADEINSHRLTTWDNYFNAFVRYQDRGLRVPYTPSECKHNGHLFHLILPDEDARHEFIARMRTDDVMTPFHYVPLHSAPAGKFYGRVHADLPCTDDLSARLVRLPLFPNIGDLAERVVERACVHLDALL